MDSRALDEASVIFHKLKIEVQRYPKAIQEENSKDPKATQVKLRMHLIIKPRGEGYLLKKLRNDLNLGRSLDWFEVGEGQGFVKGD